MTGPHQSAPVRVVGLDMSLTSTGMSDGETHRAVQTSADERLEARLDRLTRAVVQFVLGTADWPREATLAVMEDGVFVRKGTGHEELAALRLMTRTRLWRLDIPVALVRPTTLKAYTTGDGKASKDQMVAAVDERHGTELVKLPKSHGRYDQADALALAAMGYHRVQGQPLPQHFPARPPYAPPLDVVAWPTLVSD